MKILFLCHNTPYPPNKGEKIRAFHQLKKLAEKNEVHLYSLVKDSADLQHKETLESLCHTVRLFPMSHLFSKIKSLICIPSPFPMTFGYYYSYWLHRELKKAVAKENFDLVFAYCSSMGQYLPMLGIKNGIIDFVDIDSIKWWEYSRYENFPMSWVYTLEHFRLKKWEKILSSRTLLNLVTTQAEKEKLAQINFSSVRTTKVVRVGIEQNLFPETSIEKQSKNIIFVGQMDYLPNIDAVIYFYLNIFPLIKKEIPHAHFQIVGRNPSDELIEICEDAEVTGEVESVRPYLEQASVFVAPLRLAFGVQTKIIEAMAAGVPVISTSKVLSGIKAKKDRDILCSDKLEEFANYCVLLINDRERAKSISKNAKRFVKEMHNWDIILDDFEKVLYEALD